MSKLYIFGIGGTGSRVLKSLVMLLASGVKINVPEIVPIIIDPDSSSGDLTRTIELIKTYNRIRDKIKFSSVNKDSFFKTEINTEIVPNLLIPLSHTQNESFKEFIGLEQMVNNGNKNLESNYALASILFSQQNLNSSMDVGFKGNPNIGSVVLNQFKDTEEFRDFADSFKDGDKIFIISSIFGGTGASGFPLLLKNLRTIGDEINGSAIIKKSSIGAISVLPYFDVKRDNEEEEDKRSQIDSSTFISKTKAALSYYDNNIKETNALYYIGDTIPNPYENSEGGTNQKNMAHFIELASALAIIDFSSIDFENAFIPMFKEFGINNVEDNVKIIFGDLKRETNDLIEKPLIQFMFFTKYLKNYINKYSNTYWIKKNKIDDNFLNSVFIKDLNYFQDKYIEWLNEMSENNRAFSPFNLKNNSHFVFDIIDGISPKKRKIFSDLAFFDIKLNECENKSKSNRESKFINLFYEATSKIAKEKFNL